MKSRRNACALAAMLLLGAGAMAQTAPADEGLKAAPAQTVRSWTLALPTTDPVAFKGIANFDGAGNGGPPMAYPAPNIAGLLVAVLVHGALNEATKSAQKSEIQQAADKVLLPYQPVLANFTHAQLMRDLPISAVDASGVAGSSAGPIWRIDSKPVFGVTPDQAALVLENSVAVYRIGTAGPAVYQSSIKVVSGPADAADPVAYWTADGGKRLREEAAALLQESAELAAGTAAGTLPTGTTSTRTQKTFRYFEGVTERMERAELIADRCARRVLRTLRDTLLSIPGDPKSSACSAPVVANQASASATAEP